MGKKQARRQDLEELEAKVRMLQRALSRLRKRLERHETVEPEFYSMSPTVEEEPKKGSKDPSEVCESCSGEISILSLGMHDYRICRSCLKRSRVA